MATIFYPANAPLVNYFFYNFTLTAGGPNLPLAGGKIYFRKDEDHTQDANTYSDVSDPANPVVNPNPLPLNAVGAWPFFYAEDRLYYIVITGPDGDFDNPIWTFSHINFAGAPGTLASNITNYVPNGQFLAHNVQAAVPPYAEGEIRADSTEIAYGNWTFDRSHGSTSKDFITFEPYTAWSNNPDGNPRYALRLQSTAPDAADTVKDIRVKYFNVNRFSSTTQTYTFAFSGKDNLAGSTAVDLYLIKNFGTSGATTTETLLKTFNLTAAETIFYHSFVFGDNAGKTIGTQNDDYVQLALRCRTDEVLDLLITDVIQEQGTVVSPAYPERTQSQDIAVSIGGAFPIPDPAGMDLYLKPQLTANGWRYDDSEIGDVIAESQLVTYTNSLHPSSNRMLGDGNQYKYTNYAPIGIPFKRLADKYWDNTKNVFIHGTGRSYFTGYYSGSGNELVLSNNSNGAVTDTANGAATTGFTFLTIHTGANYYTKAYLIASDTFYLQNIEFGAVTASAAQTSGFTLSTIQVGSSILGQITSIQTTVATALAGKYFNFDSYHAGDLPYYCWFKVDGSGADPAPGGRTGILVNLNSTDTAAIVAEKIREALNGWQTSSIKTVAASAITAGAYFTANSSGTTPESYYVWYKKDGAGTDPAVGGKIGIEVDIVAADTNAQVAVKTQIAINKTYFASPDYQGYFLRGISNASGNDPDVDFRYSLVPGVIGNMLGTFEGFQVQSHSHAYTVVNGGGADIQGGATFALPNLPTGNTGGAETRPINAYVNYAIIY